MKVLIRECAPLEVYEKSIIIRMLRGADSLIHSDSAASRRRSFRVKVIMFFCIAAQILSIRSSNVPLHCGANSSNTKKEKDNPTFSAPMTQHNSNHSTPSSFDQRRQIRGI